MTPDALSALHLAIVDPNATVPRMPNELLTDHIVRAVVAAGWGPVGEAATPGDAVGEVGVEGLTTPRPWPENAWPTVAELADWLSRCTSDERMSYADQSLTTAHAAARCLDQNHAALLAELQSTRERLRVVEGEREAALAETEMLRDGRHCPKCGRHDEWSGDTHPGAPCMGCGRYPAARAATPDTAGGDR